MTAQEARKLRDDSVAPWLGAEVKRVITALNEWIRNESLNGNSSVSHGECKISVQTPNGSYSERDLVKESVYEDFRKRGFHVDMFGITWRNEIVTHDIDKDARIKELETIIERDRENVAKYIRSCYLAESWLQFFRESGLVYFDKIGYLRPVPLSGVPDESQTA